VTADAVITPTPGMVARRRLILRSKLAEAEASRKILEHDSHFWRAQLEQAEQQAIDAGIERDQALQARDAVLSSTAWRVTRPLRLLRTLAELI
jgi:hypothetical protein